PRAIFDYMAGGAEDEVTLRRNREAFGRWALRPRVLMDVSKRDTKTVLLGERVSMPVCVAPTSFHALVHPEGEVATARGAAAAETILIASTISTKPLEEVAAAADAPRWFQLYVYRDRAVTEELVARAVKAGYKALCLTADTPVLGRRERDERNAFTLPPGFGIANLKGAGLDALPDVVAAVRGRIEVYLEGGIRRGTDVLKALALGAKAVLVGRPILWGLALGGADGVRAVLDQLHTELDTAMALAGRANVKGIDASLVVRAA